MIFEDGPSYSSRISLSDLVFSSGGGSVAGLRSCGGGLTETAPRSCDNAAGSDSGGRLLVGGGGEAVLAGHLFAAPGFTVIGADAPQAAPQWGLFETAPAAAREKALAWQRHVREVERGLPGGPGSEGAVREQYDPERYTLAEREQAKAQELTALGFGRVSRTTVQRMRLAYRKQGLWRLLDHRTTRASSPTGRSDERVVAAVREALRRRRGRSKGTTNGLSR